MTRTSRRRAPLLFALALALAFALAACGPEASRERGAGAGSGADVGNRAATPDLHGDVQAYNRIYHNTPRRESAAFTAGKQSAVTVASPAAR